jgi:hypothetical protein
MSTQLYVIAVKTEYNFYNPVNNEFNYICYNINNGVYTITPDTLNATRFTHSGAIDFISKSVYYNSTCKLFKV